VRSNQGDEPTWTTNHAARWTRLIVRTFPTIPEIVRRANGRQAPTIRRLDFIDPANTFELSSDEQYVGPRDSVSQPTCKTCGGFEADSPQLARQGVLLNPSSNAAPTRRSITRDKAKQSRIIGRSAAPAVRFD
jgi:hypothetical protein